ncbi:TPA: hypothetical protein N0F65_010505 [Lagenidium giganteum]|uniref:Uncharacterized protein n=1 Tax=Lagenidium giganteum TaxID=4803 RepID=A0AAV2Z9Y1_9STRA|nr:TPA: hypothetical protein N0F65_010505 [Lagenidium giganteum]
MHTSLLMGATRKSSELQARKSARILAEKTTRSRRGTKRGRGDDEESPSRTAGREKTSSTKGPSAVNDASEENASSDVGGAGGASEAAGAEAMEMNATSRMKEVAVDAGMAATAPGSAEDAPRVFTEAELTARITSLVAKNEQLSAEIDTLKRSFTVRDDQTNRLLLELTTLSKMENELADLQRGYQESSRKNVALIQEALKRITFCSSTVESLKHCGSMTAIQLQTFRKECSDEINSLISKLEDIDQQPVGAAAAAVDKCTELADVAGTMPVIVSEDCDELMQLKKQIAACRKQLDEIEPRRSAIDNEIFDRMDKFTNQLKTVHEHMIVIEQNLALENQTCHRSMEKLLSRQMGHFREEQDAESKRLQDEMDELRSDMCDVLKEMHLLKERSKFWSPKVNMGFEPGPPRRPSQGVELDETTVGDPTMGTTTVDSNIVTATVLASNIQPENVGKTIENDRDVDPPNPGFVPKSCASPHYSSRSSSMSGRISISRDGGTGAEATPAEVERRLLEQHRRFWIGEGAG